MIYCRQLVPPSSPTPLQSAGAQSLYVQFTFEDPDVNSVLRALSAVANDEYLNQIKAYLTSIGGLTNIQAIADGEYQFPNSERRTSQISIRSSIW